MKKSLLALSLVCGALLSCSKSSDHLDSQSRNFSQINPDNSDLKLRAKFIELQSQGYFRFMPSHLLSQGESHLRATTILSSSFLDFLDQKDVLAIFDQASATDIAKLLEVTESYKKLDPRDKKLVMDIFTNTYVIMSLDDFNTILSTSDSELRSLTYGQFYTITGYDKNSKKFIAKAAIAAGVAVACGAGPFGAGVAALGSMLTDLISMSSVTTTPTSTTSAYLEAPIKKELPTAVALP